MRKKRLIVLGTLQVALIAFGVFVFWPGDPGTQVQVVGNFSPEDLAAIKRAVRHQMWQDAGSHLSWTGIKGLGGVLTRNATGHLISIDETHITIRLNSFSIVKGSMIGGDFSGDALATVKYGTNEDSFFLTRGSNAWRCVYALPGWIGKSAGWTGYGPMLQSGILKQAEPTTETNR